MGIFREKITQDKKKITQDKKEIRKMENDLISRIKVYIFEHCNENEEKFVDMVWGKCMEILGDMYDRHPEPSEKEKLIELKKFAKILGTITEDVVLKGLEDRYEFDPHTKRSGVSGKDGATYIIRNKETGKRFALKTYIRLHHPEFNFENEVGCQLMVNSSVPNPSPEIYEIKRNPPRILMELMKETIIDYCRRKGNNNPYTFKRNENILLIGAAIALDLSGIYHNDSNPLNIMVDELELFGDGEGQGSFKWIDFGMSRMIKKKDSLFPNVRSLHLTFLTMQRKGICTKEGLDDINNAVNAAEIIFKHCSEREVTTEEKLRAQFQILNNYFEEYKTLVNCQELLTSCNGLKTCNRIDVENLGIQSGSKFIKLPTPEEIKEEKELSGSEYGIETDEFGKNGYLEIPDSPNEGVYSEYLKYGMNFPFEQY